MVREIVITGGSSGIGAEIARRFAKVGDNVTIIGRDIDRLTRLSAEIGTNCEVCELTDPRAVESLASRLPGQLDVIIAMAGGVIELPKGDTPDVLGLLAENWAASLRNNTISTVLTVTALLPKLRGGASIITVSSIGAEYASGPYGASKAAVAAWTAGLSAQVARRDITVNAIAPGYIEDTEFFGESMTAERRERLIDATHNKRAGTPGDVAGLTWFLASPDARHLTGQTIHLNGGAHTTR